MENKKRSYLFRKSDVFLLIVLVLIVAVVIQFKFFSIWGITGNYVKEIGVKEEAGFFSVRDGEKFLVSVDKNNQREITFNLSDEEVVMTVEGREYNMTGVMSVLIGNKKVYFNVWDVKNRTAAVVVGMDKEGVEKGSIDQADEIVTGAVRFSTEEGYSLVFSLVVLVILAVVVIGILRYWMNYA